MPILLEKTLPLRFVAVVDSFKPFQFGKKCLKSFDLIKSGCEEQLAKLKVRKEKYLKEVTQNRSETWPIFVTPSVTY